MGPLLLVPVMVAAFSAVCIVTGVPGELLLPWLLLLLLLCVVVLWELICCIEVIEVDCKKGGCQSGSVVVALVFPLVLGCFPLELGKANLVLCVDVWKLLDHFCLLVTHEEEDHWVRVCCCDGLVIFAF